MSGIFRKFMLAVIAVVSLFATMAPAVSSPSPDTSTTTLIKLLDQYLQEHEDSSSLFISDLHLDLAKFYIFSGQEQKGIEHISKIKLYGRKSRLLEPYAAMILEDVEKGDYDKVFSVLNNSQKINSWMENISYVPGDFDFSRTWQQVNESLCRIAAKSLAEREKFSLMKKIGDLPQCQEHNKIFSEYRLSALLVHHKLKKAYDYAPIHQVIAKSGINISSADYLINICLPKNETVQADLQDIRLLLIAQKDAVRNSDDSQKYLLADLLRHAGRNDDATELAKSIINPERRRSSLIASFEGYYLADSRQGVLKLAELLNFPGLTTNGRTNGGYGHDAWYSESKPETRILSWHPKPIAYELAMKIKDNKARFVTLKNIFYHIKGSGQTEFPGCGGPAYICVNKELLKIAAEESDEFSRDYMYGMIVIIEEAANDFEAAKVTFGKIKDHRRMICYGSLCLNGARNPTIYVQSSNNPECKDKVDSNFKETRTNEFYQIVKCQVNLDTYKSYLDKSDSLGHLQDEYLRLLVSALSSTKKYSDMLLAIKKMGNPKKRLSAVDFVWENKLKHPLVYDKSTLGEWAEYRSEVFKAISADHEFQDVLSKDLADLIGGPPTLSSCAPDQANFYQDKCTIQRRVVAEVYARQIDTLEGKEKALAARTILVNRFLNENDKFRHSINDGTFFDYIEEDVFTCPIRRDDFPELNGVPQ